VWCIHDNHHVELYMTNIMYIVKGARERMMRVSRQQVTENRRTILEVAGRLFREHGFEAVTVAEIMVSHTAASTATSRQRTS